MTTDDDSAPLVEEGERLSKEWKKMKFVICRNTLESELYLFIFGIFFISSSPPPLSSSLQPVGHISEFVSNCFFSRFTTWKSQRLPEDVVQRFILTNTKCTGPFLGGGSFFLGGGRRRGETTMHTVAITSV